MPEPTILIVSGTNRPNANARKIARILEGHYRDANIRTDLLSLTDLPPEVFEGSAYASKPPAMLAIQQRVLDAAGLHVVTPEYNGSFPGPSQRRLKSSSPKNRRHSPQSCNEP